MNNQMDVDRKIKQKLMMFKEIDKSAKNIDLEENKISISINKANLNENKDKYNNQEFKKSYNNINQNNPKNITNNNVHSVGSKIYLGKNNIQGISEEDLPKIKNYKDNYMTPNNDAVSTKSTKDFSVGIQKGNSKKLFTGVNSCPFIFPKSENKVKKIDFEENYDNNQLNENKNSSRKPKSNLKNSKSPNKKINLNNNSNNDSISPLKSILKKSKISVSKQEDKDGKIDLNLNDFIHNGKFTPKDYNINDTNSEFFTNNNQIIFGDFNNKVTPLSNKNENKKGNLEKINKGAYFNSGKNKINKSSSFNNLNCPYHKHKEEQDFSKNYKNLNSTCNVSPIKNRENRSLNVSLNFQKDSDALNNMMLNKDKNFNMVNLDNLYQGKFSKEFCELYSNNQCEIQDHVKDIKKKTYFQSYLISNSKNRTLTNFKGNEENYENDNFQIQDLNKFVSKKIQNLNNSKKLGNLLNSNNLEIINLGKTSNLFSNKKKNYKIDYYTNFPEAHHDYKKQDIDLNNPEIINNSPKKNEKNVNQYTFKNEENNQIHDANFSINNNCEILKNKEGSYCHKLTNDYFVYKNKIERIRNEENEKRCKSAIPQITKKAQNIIRENNLFHCRLYPYHKVPEVADFKKQNYIMRQSYYNNPTNSLNMNNIMYYNSQNNKSSHIIENLRRLEGIEDIKTYKIYRTSKNIENDIATSVEVYQRKKIDDSFYYPNKKRTFSFMPNLNNKSMQIAGKLQPSKERLNKKRKKKNLNYSFDNLQNNSINFNNSSINNFRLQHFTNDGQGNFSTLQRSTFRARSNSKGDINHTLDLYKRGVENIKKKEALHIKKKQDEEESYKQYSFRPEINRRFSPNIIAARKYKLENFKNENTRGEISIIHNLNMGMYLKNEDSARNSHKKSKINEGNSSRKSPENEEFKGNVKILRHKLNFYEKSMNWKQNVQRKFNKLKADKENEYKNIHTFKPEIQRIPIPTDETFIEKNIDQIQEYVNKRRLVIQKNIKEDKYRKSKYHFGDNYKIKTTIPKEFNLSYMTAKEKNLSKSISNFNTLCIEKKHKGAISEFHEKFSNLPVKSKKNDLQNIRNNLKIHEFFEFDEIILPAGDSEISERYQNSHGNNRKNYFSINTRNSLNNVEKQNNNGHQTNFKNSDDFEGDNRVSNISNPANCEIDCTEQNHNNPNDANYNENNLNHFKGNFNVGRGNVYINNNYNNNNFFGNNYPHNQHISNGNHSINQEFFQNNNMPMNLFVNEGKKSENFKSNKFNNSNKENLFKNSNFDDKNDSFDANNDYQKLNNHSDS